MNLEKQLSFLFLVFVVFGSLFAFNTFALCDDETCNYGYEAQYNYEAQYGAQYGNEYNYEAQYGAQYGAQYSFQYGGQYNFQYSAEYAYQAPRYDDPNYTAPKHDYPDPAQGSALPPGGYGCEVASDCRANPGGVPTCCNLFADGLNGSRMCASTAGGPYCQGASYSYQSPADYPVPVNYATPTGANQPPYGFLDAANCSIIGGWAYDPDHSNSEISVQIYKDGLPSAANFLMSVTTTGYRSDVNSARGISGNHGFTVTTPNSVKDGLSHFIRAYAVDSTQSSNSAQLNASPIIIECPPENLMSGNLTAESPSCSIAEGQDSCNINFSWNVANPVSTTAVTKPVNVTVGTGNAGNDVPFEVEYNSQTFYLYNNSQLLDQESVSAVCTAGTSWNDATDMCVSDTAGSCVWGPWGSWSACSNGQQSRNRNLISGPSSCSPATQTQACVVGSCISTNLTADPTFITPSGSSTLAWCAPSVPCTATSNPVDTTWDGTKSDLNGSFAVSPDYTTTYTLTCGASADSVTIYVRERPWFIED